MAVKIRLKRFGRSGLSQFRIVVADSRSPRDGRFIEEIGIYNPNLKENKVTLDKELALKWLKQGAQPTDTAKNILSESGVLQALHNELSK